MSTFVQRIHQTARRNDSWVCIGLDPDPARLPRVGGISEELEGFLIDVIDDTKDLVCAYKPNSAFFEAIGEGGERVLRRVIDHARRFAPVILDGKRGDIGNTANAYATWAYDVLNADAATVAPYMGHDSVDPFAGRADRGVFILARTSNPGGADLQLQRLATGERLYEHVARLATGPWNGNRNVGLVAGATAPEELRRIREIAGSDTLLLIPGVGAQGGSAETAIRLGANAEGDNAIVNSSRAILYSPSSPRDAATALRDELNKYRPR